MTTTTKVSANGTRLYYVGGKRTSRDKAITAAIENRAGKSFTVEYDTEQNHFFLDRPSETAVYTARKVVVTDFNLKIDAYHGFTVMLNGSTIRKFFNKDAAKALSAKIEDSFLGGEHGVKISLDGTISTLPEIENANAGNTVDEDEIENYYTISKEAFDLAVEWEIEFAEEAAYEAKHAVFVARMLADDELAARYEKAKSQVKRDRYSWYFKGKNRDEWERNERKAAACLSRYGLSRSDFSIFHEAEVAAIKNAGYDESAFDLLPNVDELKDIDDLTKQKINI